MNEYIGLILALTFLIGMVIGHKSSSSQWAGKAKAVMRKEHDGKLYWVLEDGDWGKLEQIKDDFGWEEV